MNTVLIIDDEKDIRNMLGRILELEGYDILKAENARTGLQLFENNAIQLVLLDVKLPDGNGIQLLSNLKSVKPEVEIVCMTAYGKIQDGVAAIKNGAFDYLVKGDDNHKIIPVVSKAMEKARLQFRIAELQKKVEDRFGFDGIIGQSRQMQAAIDLARKVAPLDTTVLLTGPTGTGKEVFARAIYAAGRRSLENFVAINCSALGKDLLESELFGHAAGAFTGAVRDKKGLFQEADKGTIFLDEIGELDLDLQAKILRVLEHGTFIRLGETKETKVDVRVIAATNRRLEEEAGRGNFREDLFYRLSVFSIALPPLDERKEDIPALTEHFVQSFARKMKKASLTISPAFMDALLKHQWKGNIRELRNVIERSVILCENNTLSPDLLPFKLSEPATPGLTGGIFKMQDLEKEHIKNILAYTEGNKTRTAKLLDISLTTLYNKIREYQIAD